MHSVVPPVLLSITPLVPAVHSGRPSSVLQRRRLNLSPVLYRMRGAEPATCQLSPSTLCAAKYPHIPWTPPPGGVDAEQM